MTVDSLDKTTEYNTSNIHSYRKHYSWKNKEEKRMEKNDCSTALT